jgi:hypothetical protein
LVQTRNTDVSVLRDRTASVLPFALYVVIATAFLGFMGWLSATDMLLENSARDIWQHAAALRALIADLANPANPFVVADTGSRHFHPLWVGWAAVAQAAGLDVWDVLAGAAYLSMAVLGTGIYLFARALHSSPWAPLVVFLCLMLGWILPIQHTGFHAPATLLYAAAYPATYLVGLSFMLWGLVLRSLDRPTLVVILGAACGFYVRHPPAWRGHRVCRCGVLCRVLATRDVERPCGDTWSDLSWHRGVRAMALSQSDRSCSATGKF